MTKKLNSNDVIEIKRKLEEGELTQKEIADQFGISPSNVNNIKNGRTWTDVSADDELTDSKVRDKFKTEAMGDVIRGRLISKISIKDSGCWEWEGTTSDDGYGQMGIDGKIVYTHRIAYRMSKGSLDGKQVNHHCDNKPCLNPDHIYAGTPKENAEDAFERGQMVTGEEHCKSKLTEKEVREIKKRLEGEETQSEIATDYGIYQSHVSMIKNGDAWRGVEL